MIQKPVLFLLHRNALILAHTSILRGAFVQHGYLGPTSDTSEYLGVEPGFLKISPGDYNMQPGLGTSVLDALSFSFFNYKMRSLDGHL